MFDVELAEFAAAGKPLLLTFNLDVGEESLSQWGNSTIWNNEQSVVELESESGFLEQLTQVAQPFGPRRHGRYSIEVSQRQRISRSWLEANMNVRRKAVQAYIIGGGKENEAGPVVSSTISLHNSIIIGSDGNQEICGRAILQIQRHGSRGIFRQCASHSLLK